MRQPTTTDGEPAPRREVLLSRLVQLFAREGFAALNVAALAERLRCSKSTLYLVAPSREQIVVAAARSFFRQAADRIEARVAATADPVDRLRAYLLGVAVELEQASEVFYADLTGFPPAREVYQENTLYAAHRVRDLVARGVDAGAFRPVHAAFVGAAVTQVMTAIQGGRIRAATGLTDADAYRQLADLVLTGLGAAGGTGRTGPKEDA